MKPQLLLWTKSTDLYYSCVLTIWIFIEAAVDVWLINYFLRESILGPRRYLLVFITNAKGIGNLQSRKRKPLRPATLLGIVLLADVGAVLLMLVVSTAQFRY